MNQQLLQIKIEEKMSIIDKEIIALRDLVMQCTGEWADDVSETYDALYDEVGNFNAVASPEISRTGKLIE